MCAEGCNRVLRQELTEAGGRAHAGLLSKAKEREFDARKRFKAFSPVKMETRAKEVADTWRALAREEVEGKQRRRPVWLRRVVRIRFFGMAMSTSRAA